MDDKKLHRLNKTELLWIIRDQEAELEELRAYIEELGGDPNRSLFEQPTEQEQPAGQKQSAEQEQPAGQEQPDDALQTDEGDAS